MTVLVTAASGKVGREVLAQLHARDVDVRAASRRSVVPLDWVIRRPGLPCLTEWTGCS